MYAGVLHTLHTWYCGTFVLCTFMINVIKLSLGTFLYTTGTTCTCTCIQHKLKFQFNISVDLHVFYIAYGATGARVLYMNVYTCIIDFVKQVHRKFGCRLNTINSCSVGEMNARFHCTTH